jgi:hypothetical protein
VRWERAFGPDISQADLSTAYQMARVEKETLRDVSAELDSGKSGLTKIQRGEKLRRKEQLEISITEAFKAKQKMLDRRGMSAEPPDAQGRGGGDEPAGSSDNVRSDDIVARPSVTDARSIARSTDDSRSGGDRHESPQSSPERRGRLSPPRGNASSRKRAFEERGGGGGGDSSSETDSDSESESSESTQSSTSSSSDSSVSSSSSSSSESSDSSRLKRQ